MLLLPEQDQEGIEEYSAPGEEKTHLDIRDRCASIY